MREAVVLYSGGTDSTCAAALKSAEHDKLHLITCKRFGLFCIENTGLNVQKLKNKFGKEKFVHLILDVDKLFKEVSYAQYWFFLRKYGFFLLSTCGLCKLAMHTRSIIYCIEHEINFVYDGANKEMEYFPAQMREVINEIKMMYAQYGIVYTSPVFEFNKPTNCSWLDKLGLRSLWKLDLKEKKKEIGFTSGKMLFQLDILPSENIKGTKMDHQMQARCFQLILFNIFVHWYFVPTYGFSKYKEICVSFYREKIEYFRTLIDEYLEKKDKSKLYRMI